MSLQDKQVDFPVAFAETVTCDNGDDSGCYLDWLQNDSEFPSLTTKNAADWELLERKEIYKESLTVQEEEDNWSKVNDLNMHTFVEIVEKNAKPSERILQPIWPHQNHTHQKRSWDIHDDEDNDYDFTTIYSMHKARSKDALRSGHLRTIHDLKALDHNFPGLYRMAISRSKETPIYPEFFHDPFFSHYRPYQNGKGHALKFIANFYYIKNKVDYVDKTRHKIDYSDYSVLEPSKKRKHVSY